MLVSAGLGFWVVATALRKALYYIWSLTQFGVPVLPINLTHSSFSSRCHGLFTLSTLDHGAHFVLVPLMHPVLNPHALPDALSSAPVLFVHRQLVHFDVASLASPKPNHPGPVTLRPKTPKAKGVRV